MEQKGSSPASKNGRAAPAAEGAAQRSTARHETKRGLRHRHDRGDREERHAAAPRARREADATASVAAAEALEAGQEKLAALGRALEEQLQERPYVTLAAAVGAGVVLAQAFRSKVGRFALLVAAGYAATRFVQSDGLAIVGSLLGGELADDEDEDEDEDDDHEVPERDEPSADV